MNDSSPWDDIKASDIGKRYPRGEQGAQWPREWTFACARPYGVHTGEDVVTFTALEPTYIVEAHALHEHPEGIDFASGNFENIKDPRLKEFLQAWEMDSVHFVTERTLPRAYVALVDSARSIDTGDADTEMCLGYTSSGIFVASFIDMSDYGVGFLFEGYRSMLDQFYANR